MGDSNTIGFRVERDGEAGIAVGMYIASQVGGTLAKNLQPDFKASEIYRAKLLEGFQAKLEQEKVKLATDSEEKKQQMIREAQSKKERLLQEFKEHAKSLNMNPGKARYFCEQFEQLLDEMEEITTTKLNNLFIV